jgi:hypothetical protein
MFTGIASGEGGDFYPLLAEVGKGLTFPYRDFSEYACGLADNIP